MKLLMCCLMVMTVGCVHTSMPVQPVDLGVCGPVLQRCEIREDEDLCRSAITCFSLLGAAAKCEAQLEAANSLCAIDALQREQEIRSLSHQRWMYGVVGIAVGAIITGLTVGLTK